MIYSILVQIATEIMDLYQQPVLVFSIISSILLGISTGVCFAISVYTVIPNVNRMRPVLLAWLCAFFLYVAFMVYVAFLIVHLLCFRGIIFLSGNG